MTIIEKIKTEIERRKKEIHATLFNDEFDSLLSFLSTLESEKPMNPDGLEEEISCYLREECSNDDEPSISEAARHFAKWGAEHTPLPEDTVLFNKGVEEGRRLEEEEQADLFTIVALDAAQRAKEQMMREAVEGVVTYDNFGNNVIRAGEFNKDFEYGDKVRIIIVKED